MKSITIKVSNETYDDMVSILKKYGLKDFDLSTSVSGFVIGYFDYFEHFCRLMVEAKKKGML